MHLSPGQFPYKPGIHRAEQQLSALCPLSGPIYMIQDPLQFSSGKICIYNKPCFFSDSVCKISRFEFIAELRCSAALPNYSVINRLTGFSVPDYGRLSLVRDAYTGDIIS